MPLPRRTFLRLAALAATAIGVLRARVRASLLTLVNLGKIPFPIARLAAFVAGSLAPAFATAAPDFVRDVRPILAAHCVKCHGPEKQKSGCRLEEQSLALTRGGGSAPTILAGPPPRARHSAHRRD